MTKQQIQQEAQKAQQKYIDLAFILGREYVDYQNRIVELQEKLKAIEAEEVKQDKPKK